MEWSACLASSSEAWLFPPPIIRSGSRQGPLLLSSHPPPTLLPPGPSSHHHAPPPSTRPRSPPPPLSWSQVWQPDDGALQDSLRTQQLEQLREQLGGVNGGVNAAKLRAGSRAAKALQQQTGGSDSTGSLQGLPASGQESGPVSEGVSMVRVAPASRPRSIAGDGQPMVSAGGVQEGGVGKIGEREGGKVGFCKLCSVAEPYRRSPPSP